MRRIIADSSFFNEYSLALRDLIPSASIQVHMHYARVMYGDVFPLCEIGVRLLQCNQV